MSNGYNQFFKEARKKNGLSPSNSEEMKQFIAQRKQSAVRRRQKAQKKRFPIGAGVSLVVALAVGIYLSYNPKSLEGLIENVEIGFLGAAQATEAATSNKEAKTSATKGQEAVNSAAGKNTPEGETTKEPSTQSPEQVALFKGLEERSRSLDQREQELKRLEEELQKQKESLDKRLVELEQVRKSIASQLEEKVKVDQERVDQLVQFYSTMKPQQAAKIIESLNEDLAVEVLLKMKKKSAAEVMNLIDSSKAQRLSEKFAGYRRK